MPGGRGDVQKNGFTVLVIFDKTIYNSDFVVYQTFEPETVEAVRLVDGVLFWLDALLAGDGLHTALL